MSDTAPLPEWKRVYRDGFLPLTSTPALKALQRALEEDDPALIHGATLRPPPIQCNMDEPCRGGCLAAYGGWKGDSLETVAEVEEYFGRMSVEVDGRIGRPSVCGAVYGRWDEVVTHPERRATIRAEFLEEINLALAQREAAP